MTAALPNGWPNIGETLDGNGTGFAKISDMATELNIDYSGESVGLRISLITRLLNGNLVCLLPFDYESFSNPIVTIKAVYSSDNGATWTVGAHVAFGLIDRMGSGSSNSIMLLGNDSFVTAMTRSTGSQFFVYWTSSGAVYTITSPIGWDGGANATNYMGFVNLGDKIYAAKYNDAG